MCSNPLLSLSRTRVFDGTWKTFFISFLRAPYTFLLLRLQKFAAHEISLNSYPFHIPYLPRLGCWAVPSIHGFTHNKTINNGHAAITISPNKNFRCHWSLEADHVEWESNFLHIEVFFVGPEDHESIRLVVITPFHMESARIFRLIHSYGFEFVSGVTELVVQKGRGT